VFGIGRLLILAGAAGVAASAVLPWVTIEGAPLHLDWIGADASLGSKTVSGTDTPAAGPLLGVGGAVAALALVNFARKLLIAVGTLVTLAGAALMYYVLNVIDIETSGRTVIEQTVAGAALASSAGAGPPLLLAGGIAILVGAILR
jgi:hypothetical protein